MQLDKFSIEMLVYALMLMGVAVFAVIHSGRKKKDEYGFALPGWDLLKDDEKLWQIELAFTNGFVASALGQQALNISSWHSNFQKKQDGYFTGYVRLGTVQTIPTLNLGVSSDSFGNFGVGFLFSTTKDGRYFLANLQKPCRSLIFLHSGSLDQIQHSSLPSIEPEIRDFEKQFGLGGWSLIAYENSVAVFVTEIFQQKELDRFLKCCDSLVAKMNA